MSEAGKSMTLNLSPQEDVALSALSEDLDMSRSAVMRQALRLYQSVHVRMKRGEILHFKHEGKVMEVELIR